MECQTKYGNTSVWEYFTDMFDFIPISALINNEIFCVHGGLSPAVETINEIESLNRFSEIPHEGTFTDLMWSDPDLENTGFTLSPRYSTFFNFFCLYAILILYLQFYLNFIKEELDI